MIACAGGRGELDDAAAAMLAQVLKAQGAITTCLGHCLLEPGRLRQLSLDDAETVMIVFLNPLSVQHARNMTRRLKRSRPKVSVGILLWNCSEDALEPVKRAAEMGSDFVANSLEEARNLRRQSVNPSPRQRLPQAQRPLSHARNKQRSDTDAVPRRARPALSLTCLLRAAEGA